LLLEKDVYRQLYNPNLYLLAYSRISKNDGALTPGITKETADGMSMKKIEAIIEQLRYERFRWTPVRRVEIPKKNGKKRPLGLPTWTDKLVQEVIRLILEAFYEPQFSTSSHGFRPGRGCDSALTTIDRTWQGMKWFLEGDIRGCFDHIDHDILMEILREKIKDNRFLRLIENLLKAGYCEEWSYRPTLSGTPQGGIVSPILSNIYLDQLDKFVEQTLIPEYTRGQRRAENKEYAKLQKLAWYYGKTGQPERAHELELQYQRMPSKDVNDPGYRRLAYLRYADDFLLAFIGPLAEAQTIKAKLSHFLKERLKLDLSEEKTLITHAQTETAKFLGYEIGVQHEDTKHTQGRRSINGIVGLRVPAKVVEEKSALYTRHGKPTHRPELLDEDDYTIISLYQSEYRGYVQYYTLAQNIAWLNNVRTVMRLSLLKTLANKHKTSVAQMRAKYQKTVRLPQGPRQCIEITVEREGKKPLRARFGGIPLKRDPKTRLQDQPTTRKPPSRSELIKRLLADTCEVCGAMGNIEVHHIHALKDLKGKGRKEKPLWMQIMSARRRKTLMVCKPCHMAIQYGKPVRKHVSK
jgi:group II intron reverse transcriptase/maturase